MEKDLQLKRYLSDNDRYADLINGFCFGGKQIVKADALEEMDTQTSVWLRLPFSTRGKRKRNAKYRDLIRKVALGVGFVVVGIENQDEVNYLMPLRTMEYDAGEYGRQAAAIRKIVRKKKGIAKGEFLSGFEKDSRLHPCVTIVIFFGKKWDGSRDLHEILDFADIPEEMRGLIGNYRINLLEVRKINPAVFKTDLKQVFNFVRNAEDKVKLKELVQSDPAYLKMEEDAYETVAAFTGTEEFAVAKQQYMEGGKVNMCRAIKEMLEDSRMEGREEGIRGFVSLCCELKFSQADTKDKIEEKYCISREEAGKYIEKYWEV